MSQEVFLPLEVIQASSGVAFDIGGSVAKILYRDKNYYKQGRVTAEAKADSQYAPLELIKFPRDAVEEYIGYLQDNADITPGEGDNRPVVYCTGFGGLQFKSYIDEKLRVNLQTVTEFDAYSKAIMAALQQKEFMAINSAGVTLAISTLRRALQFAAMASGETPKTEEEVTVMVANTVRQMEEMSLTQSGFPSLILMCGSAFSFQELSEAGKLSIVDVSFFGGACFLSMTAVMTGIKDWSEIYKLVETSDGRTIDSYTTDSKPNRGKDDKSDPYAETMGAEKSARILPFAKGHTLPRDQIKDGDLIHSMFELICDNLALTAYNMAVAKGYRRILFCGGFVELEKAQEFITNSLLWRIAFGGQEHTMNFQFMKDAGRLGVVGTFLHYNTCS